MMMLLMLNAFVIKHAATKCAEELQSMKAGFIE
jgi:hypothetical protein